MAEETLKEDDIEMLLRVLEFDGRIERLPAVSSVHLPVSVSSDEDEEDEEDTRSVKSKGSAKSGGHKRKRKQGDSDEEMDDRQDPKKRKVPDDSDDGGTSQRKKGKGLLESSDEDSDDNRRRPTKGKATKKGGKKDSSKAKGKGGHFDSEENYDDIGVAHHGAFVYRAIYPSTAAEFSTSKQEEGSDGSLSIFGSTLIDTGGSIFNGAWLGGEGHLPWAEAPCVRCPQAEFCQEKGPVNASSCRYYDEWLEPEKAGLSHLMRMDDSDEIGPNLAIEMET